MSKREARAARQAALEAKKQRQRQVRIAAIAGASVLAGAAIIWMVVSIVRRPVEAVASNPDITATEITVDSEGASHLQFGQKATYAHYPPSSGPHWNEAGVAPAAWGYYSDLLPPEVWVHNLEHGGVVVLYNCPEACPDLVQSLKDLAASVPASRFGTQKILITADPLIPSKVIALAWTRELDLSDFDEARLLEFYKHWVDSGPEQTP